MVCHVHTGQFTTFSRASVCGVSMMACPLHCLYLLLLFTTTPIREHASPVAMFCTSLAQATTPCKPRRHIFVSPFLFRDLADLGGGGFGASNSARRTHCHTIWAQTRMRNHKYKTTITTRKSILVRMARNAAKKT